MISAVVSAPNGSAHPVLLRDDGLSGDGRANDGLYGAVFRKTLWRGAYAMRVNASGTSHLGTAFRREQSAAFELHDAPDADGDGLPDWWERRNGTDPQQADDQADPDGDGLTNADELRLHTSPLQSDTDFGGESDATEAARGSDPRDAHDDGIRPPTIAAIAGNGRALVRPSCGAGQSVEVQRATAATGAFATVAVFACPVEVQANPVANDTTICYRARTHAGPTAPVTSAWTDVVCVIPKVDPYPPTLAPRTPSYETWTRTRLVRIALNASDSSGAEHTSIDRDPTVVPSGVKEMMVSSRADFGTASWQPYESVADLWLDDAPAPAVWIKVRDAAGNESSPAVVGFRRLNETPVDSALRKEESALDRMAGGAWADARSLIASSLPDIDTSVRATTKRIASHAQHPDPEDVKLLEALLAIRADKGLALALARPLTGKLAREALERALARERTIAGGIASAEVKP